MAAPALKTKVVATDGLVWAGDAVTVLVRTTEGDIGVMANHEPLMAALVPHGAEIVDVDGERRIFAISGGFISVRRNHVSILSAFGQSADDISLSDVQAEWTRIKELCEQDDDVNQQRLVRQLEAQVKAAEKVAKQTGRLTGHI